VPVNWREGGGVLLVSSYELGHQPLGLAYPLAFLERAGFRPASLDLAVERLDGDAIAAARFIGFSVPMHTAMRVALRAAERARAENPAAHLCFYGLYAPLNQALLAAPHASGRPLGDSVLGGEVERALCELVGALERGDAPGRTTPPPTLARLDFVTPSRRALPALDRYARLLRPDGSEATAGYTEATRGCLHRCRHCPIPAVYDGRFFAVPLEVVRADVRAQLEAGAAHVTLGDPDFLNGPRHALAVARALHEDFPRLTFDITTKVEHLLRHADLLPELADLGCLFITTAVESLSERVLAILDKGHGRADVERALERVRAAGITLRPTFVPFTPWGTLDEHLALFDFLEARGLLPAVDPVQLTIRLLLPTGSLLLGHPEMAPHLGPLDDSALSYRWVHPDPRMDELQRRSAELAAHAEERGHPPAQTFAHLHRLALAAAGRAAPLPETPPKTHARAPRLSESWFC